MLNHLHKLQSINGSFPAMVQDKQRTLVDSSGFTTVLVLRSLRGNQSCASFTQLRKAALQYISTCKSPNQVGAYEFWPPNARPDWAPSFPADLDDTATMLHELLRYGWVSPQQVRKQVCRVFSENRVRLKRNLMRPVWISDGAFHTWITKDKNYPNVVDCTVNANALSLLHLLDLKDLPGCQAAIDPIPGGCLWAGNDRDRLQSLSPFYPDATELYFAVAHAVENGVEQLRAVRDQLFKVVQTDIDCNSGAHCRNAYGDVVWKSPALAIARKIARSREYLEPQIRFDDSARSFAPIV